MCMPQSEVAGMLSLHEGIGPGRDPENKLSTVAQRRAEKELVIMRAVTIVEKALTIREHSELSPARGEVVVAVRSAGLNGADMLQLRGHYPAPAGSPPDIPGLEFAGEVLATGEDAARFRPGDRVMGVVGGGGQAEQVVVHERGVMPVPDGVSWPAAGGFPEAFATAYDALFSQGGLSLGETLLVHGGAGGVGTASIQLAVRTGAKVVATVRDQSLRGSVAALGALAVEPSEFAEHGPFDVVLELVGAVNMAANLDALATGGRIVVIGVGAGFKCEVNLLSLMGRRGRILGSTLRARSLEEKAEVSRQVEKHVLPALKSGELKVPLVETYPMEDVEAAYERFRAGGKFGKIILTMGDVGR